MRSARDTALFPEIHLPTSARPRHYTVRAHTYAWMDTFDGGTVPCLSIHGRWLESAGFKVGASVSIEATQGQLIVTLIEYPEEARRSTSTAFEKHIAKLGRTTPDSRFIVDHPAGWCANSSSPRWAPPPWTSPTPSAYPRTSPNASSPATRM